MGFQRTVPHMDHRPVARRDKNRMRFRQTIIIIVVLLLVALGAKYEEGGRQKAEAAADQCLLPTAYCRPGAPDVQGLQYGFFMALLGDNSEVRNMGFGWVEYGVFWSDEEPSPGSYSWLNGANNVDN